MANVLSRKLIKLIYLVLKTNREEGGCGPERVHKLVHMVNVLSRVQKEPALVHMYMASNS